MRFIYYYFFLLIFIFGSEVALSQPSAQVHLSGAITAKETGEPIPRASIGILGTQRGTIANSEGQYSINLEAGKSYKLRVWAIGYAPDTISITAGADLKQNISLATQAITGKEIVVSSDASRIEARRIMHEVIRRKTEWQSKLNDYTCSAYSRWNLRTGNENASTVRSVLESTADCFWKKGKGFSETITSRKQTANFAPQLNAFSVGQILNFYDNRIEFQDISLISPVADDAYGSYDYDLTGTGILNGASVYQISVEPGFFTEGFAGTIWIDQTDYTIAWLDLSTSKAVKFGPVKEIHFQQTFGLFENNFYLPIDLRTNVVVKFQMPVIPEIKFELLSVLQNYSINKGVDDSLFQKKRHRVSPTADSVKKEQWASYRVIPLSYDEERAYQRIDSTVAESKKDSSSGFSIFDILSFIDLPRYNSVEGWRFGLSKHVTPDESFPLTLRGGIAYGLTDKQWKYEAGIRQGLIWNTETRTQVMGELDGGGITSKIIKEPKVILALDAHYFYDISTMRTAYSPVENTISSLLGSSTNLGYFYEKGFIGGLDFTPDSGGLFSVYYRRTHIWDVAHTFIVNTQDSTNPKRNLGLIEISADRRLAIGGVSLAGDGKFEITSKQLGSDFTFSMIQLQLSASKKLGAIGTLELIGRYSTLFGGIMPAWHTFFFETRDAIFSKPTYFRGLEPFEFQGNRLWSLNLEHDFFDLPTRILGIHFLDQFDLHWLLHAGIGQIEMNGTGDFPITTTANKPYSEIGMGIGNILNILRIEGTWRLTYRRTDISNFYPTLGLGFSF